MANLQSPRWSNDTRKRMVELIDRGAGKHLPVVFDFDNTLVFGDIGEATLAMLAREGRIAPGQVPHLFPGFTLRDGRAALLQVSPTSSPTSPPTLSPATGSASSGFRDVTEYYEALLDPTAHGEADPTPLSSGYVWAVEIMQGLTPEDVILATEQVWQLSEPGKIKKITVTPGGSAYPVPFFYPEMVELIAELLRHDFDLWVISASNVWSVRWVVSRVLNVSLRAMGADSGIDPSHVIGVSTLLSRTDGMLCKDSVLVKENGAYATLEAAVLRELTLSRWLQFPVPTYSGKVGVIWDHIGRRPYLGAGDSPGDLPMLSFCENRLWIDRFEKPRYRKAMEITRQKHPGNWMLQTVQAGD